MPQQVSPAPLEITTLWHYRNVTITMIIITSQSCYNITGIESGCA